MAKPARTTKTRAEGPKEGTAVDRPAPKAKRRSRLAKLRAVAAKRDG